MLQHGERGGLVFVRHDTAVFFLGEGGVDALTRSADARLGHLGPPLHAWFAGRRLPLRGVGVIGVVGQAELARDVRVVLVQADHDRYELHVATIGDAYWLIGVFSGADLLRGDLGEILFGGSVHQSTSHTTDRTAPQQVESPAPQQVAESPAPPRQAKARQEPPPVADKAPQPPPPPASFTEEDRQRLETCLTPRRDEYTGAGASVMPHLYGGFRLIMEDALECLADALRQYGGPLRAKVIRGVLEAKRKALIPGCDRTFTRGLVRFLAETGLGERVGRRFQLHLADWQRVISMLRANYEPVVPTNDGPHFAASTEPQGLARSRRPVEHADFVASGRMGVRPIHWLAAAAHHHQHQGTPCRRPATAKRLSWTGRRRRLASDAPAGRSTDVLSTALQSNGRRQPQSIPGGEP